MRPVILLALIAVMMNPALALAVEPISAQTLRGYCERYPETPESVMGVKCAAYVSGFLDGAIATDVRVAENVADEIDSGESFSERAIRTRISNRIARFGPSVYAEFCIGRPVPITDVINYVIAELQRRDSLDQVAAHNIVYAAVRRHYPCE